MESNQDAMTTRIIYGEEDRLLPWAAERIGLPSFRRDAYSIGLERDGDLCAVVVFDTFSQCDVHMHIASDGSGRWMNKELLIRSFAFPFVQLGLRRITGMVPSKNARAIAFDENLGFEREGLCRDALPDDDIVVMGLLRKNCRFIAKEHRNG